MQAVLYTQDMEPITVIELTEFMRHYLDQNGCVNIPILTPTPVSCDYHRIPDNIDFKQVHITGESFWRRGERYMLLFTYDEESALLLKSVFLPGQRSTLQQHERNAFARGFTSAFASFRG